MFLSPASNRTPRRKVVWGPKRVLLAAALAAACSGLAAAPAFAKSKSVPGAPGADVKQYKLDDELTERANGRDKQSKTAVIVEIVPGAQLPPELKKFAKGELRIINGVALELPNGLLKQLAAYPTIFRVHYDRPTHAHNYRTSVTVGARAVQWLMGYTGSGVGIAVIDSGIASWHDDLTNLSTRVYPYGNQRVTKFVDFVNGRALPYDDNGHGTHVAGTILGNGYDSRFEKAGIAPDASLVSLKVLDANGQGSISRLIAALDWIAANHQTYNIRVVNMSVGAGIYESYWTDPLTLAAKRVTDLGITLVAAAGNFGKNAAGQLQWGAITAPGNAPWVLTVGASSTMGTLTRADDTMAAYSSAGPTYIDYQAKPDLVAPGTGTVSLLSNGSTFSVTKAPYIINGSNGLPVYLSLSGTSMAAPVVSGTVALMLQANPNLTPNLIKAILQYTAQKYPGYSALRQGAGFLNSLGAVELAKFYANAKAGDRMPVQAIWSRTVLWGNHRLRGGYINPRANAWAANVVWGAARTLGATGDNIVWGTLCTTCDNIVWGTADVTGDNIVWGTTVGSLADDIVWGTTFTADNIVWGTLAAGDNIVWGTACGGADCANIVWGTVDPVSNIVWGTAAVGDNIVWGTTTGLIDNIVWGTSGPDGSWGSSGDDAAVYPDDSTAPLPSTQLEFGDPTAPASTDPSLVGSSPTGGGF
jgi:serine protease AprX